MRSDLGRHPGVGRRHALDSKQEDSGDEGMLHAVEGNLFRLGASFTERLEGALAEARHLRIEVVPELRSWHSEANPLRVSALQRAAEQCLSEEAGVLGVTAHRTTGHERVVTIREPV